MGWKNRIVGHGVRPASEFKPHPRNARKHPRRQKEAVKGSLNELGWVAPVIENVRTGYLLDGHERIEEAVAAGEEVPYIQVDIDESEEDLFLTTFDYITAMAEWEREQLEANMANIQTAEAGLQQAITDLAKEQRIISEYEQTKNLPDAGPEITRAAELRQKWGTEPGQMWVLPSKVDGQSHRIICGDAVQVETLEQLMAGDQAEMVWTDPPYGVAIGDKNDFLNTIDKSNRVTENLENDRLSEPALLEMLTAVFGNAVKFQTAGGAWYVTGPAGPLHVVFGHVLKDLGIWRQTIQWVKNNATFSPMGTDYHWRAEPMFYGWLPNAGHRFYGGRRQDTVWEIDRPTKSPEHPTIKPLELVARSIFNSSQEGEIVLDMFGGSGTTIIAAEGLGRQARVVEIDPGYVAVMLDRYQATFDLIPEPAVLETSTL